MRQKMAIIALVALLSMGTFVTVANTEGQAVTFPSAALTVPSSNITDVEVSVYVNG